MADIADEATAAELPPLRSQAVARSLDGARARAEERVQRFLDAGTALILERGSLDFTVQDVVERSGQSLRSFYQFFDGKQHLLLAVYEEAIRDAAEALRGIVGDIDDPLERLRQTVLTIYEWSEQDSSAATPSPHLTVRPMASFVFELLTIDRDTVVTATEPLFQVVVDSLAEAMAHGSIQVDNVAATGGFVLQTTMFNAFGSPVDGGAKGRSARAEALWGLVLNGLAAR